MLAPHPDTAISSSFRLTFAICQFANQPQTSKKQPICENKLTRRSISSMNIQKTASRMHQLSLRRSKRVISRLAPTNQVSIRSTRPATATDGISSFSSSCHSSVVAIHGRRAKGVSRFNRQRCLLTTSASVSTFTTDAASSILPLEHEAENSISNSSSNDSNDQQTSPTNHDSNEFLARWNSLLQDLLQSSPPLSPSQWRVAEQLLKDLRTDPNAARVQQAFALLDRLCLEPNLVQSQSQQQQQQQQPNQFALSRRVWTAVLVSWQELVLGQTNDKDSSSTKSTTERHVLRQRQQSHATLAAELQPRAVLDRVHRYVDTGLVEPHAYAFSIVLQVLKRTHTIAPQEAEALFLPPRRDDDDHPSWDAPMVNHVMELWARSGRPEATQRAEQLLTRLQQEYQTTGREEFRPSVFSYCAVMEAYRAQMEQAVNSGNSHSHVHDQAVARILELWHQMRDTCEPDPVAYSRVVHALVHAPDAARAVWDEQSTSRAPPSAHALSSLVTAYGRAGRVEEAQALMEDVEQGGTLRPNAVSYNALLWAHAQAGNTEQAHAILHRLLSQDSLGLGNKMEVWNGLLISWAKSDDPQQAAQYIEQVLTKLKEQQQSNNSGECLTTSTYNTLLTCYARQKSADAGRKAEDLFQDMVSQDTELAQPNSNSLLNVITAWCNTGFPDNAEAFLSKEALRGKVDLIGKHFNVIIQAWTEQSKNKNRQAFALERAHLAMDEMKKQGISPDAFTYTSLMWAFAKSSLPDPAVPVEKLLQQMAEQCSEPPGGRSYNAVAYALARSPDPHALDRMKVHMLQMESAGIKKTFYLYNTLLMAWSKRKRPDRMEQLFQEMLENFYSTKDVELRPQTQSYEIRLNAWSRAGNPDKTVQSLQGWIEAVDGPEAQLLRVEGRPGVPQFNAVLVAWLRSNRPQAAEKAHEGLDQMHKLADTGRFDCRPNKFTYATVIGAYAKSKLPDSGERALSLLDQLKALGESAMASSTEQEAILFQPDFLIYKQVIVCLCHSSPDSQAAGEIQNLLQELHQKAQVYRGNSPFWHQAPKNLEIVHRELGQTSFSNKKELLELLEKIEIR